MRNETRDNVCRRESSGLARLGVENHLSPALAQHYVYNVKPLVPSPLTHLHREPPLFTHALLTLPPARSLARPQTRP